MKFLIFCFVLFLFQFTHSAVFPRGFPIEKFIINGEDAPLDEGKHHVEFLTNDKTKHSCGGSLIDERTVITAGHCCASYEEIGLGIVTVRYGTHFSQQSDYEDIHVDWVLIHPEYLNDRIRGNSADICIVKLQASVVKGENVAFIELQETELEPSRKAFTQYGFGRIDSQNSSPPKKMQKQVLFNVTEAEYESRFETKKEKRIILVSNPESTTCNGDSGSGLIYENKLVGVASSNTFDNGDVCPKGAWDVFSKVSSYYRWIEENRY